MSDQLIQESQAKIDALEAKVKDLEAQLRAHTEILKDKTREEIDDIHADMRKDAERLYNDLTPLVAKAKEHREEIVREVNYKICEHPGFTMALAFGAGLLLAKIFEDKIERCEHHHHL